MTQALCLRCGNIKFGAWCGCPNCKQESCGDRNLDIAFSDHFMSERTLDQFGEVFKLLQSHSEDWRVCFWAFLVFVAKSYPSVLKASPPEELATRVDTLLASVNLPEIEIEPGTRGRLDALEDRKPNPKRWWRFWR